jgi:hypothetical protein
VGRGVGAAGCSCEGVEGGSVEGDGLWWGMLGDS